MAVDPQISNLPFEVKIEYTDPARVVGRCVDIYESRTRFSVTRFIAKTPIPVGCYIAPAAVTPVHPIYGFTSTEVPTAANARLMGMAVYNRSLTFENYYFDEDLGLYVYKAGSVVTVATEGDYYQYAEVPVSPGFPVFYRIAADGAKNRIGAVSPVAGAGLVQHPRATFLENTTVPGAAAVKID